MLRVERSPLARTDIRDAAANIAIDAPEAARRFLAAVRSTVDLLAEFPMIGGAYPNDGHPGLRAKLVSGFSDYIIFYTVDNEVVQVRRVLHGARDIPSILDG